MAVLFGSASTLAEGVRASSVYTAPTAIADGDLLLLYHFEFLGTGLTGSPTATPPAGFAPMPGGTWPQTPTSDYDQWFWYKIASSESGAYTVAHAGSESRTTRGLIARVTGNDPTTPLLPNNTQGSGSAPALTTYTGLTTTVDQELIMLFGSDDNDNANAYAVAGYTLRANTPGECLLTKTLTPAGATGNPTMTNNSAGTSPWFSAMVAVQPPAVAATHTVLPDADLATTGWSTAPLFSKVNDASDATVITATLA